MPFAFANMSLIEYAMELSTFTLDYWSISIFFIHPVYDVICSKDFLHTPCKKSAVCYTILSPFKLGTIKKCHMVHSAINLYSK